MLIEFSFANYKSFKEPSTFSMVAGTSADKEQSHVFEPPSLGNFRLLKSAAIYGPNASGKSNFLRAMYDARRIIVDSAKETQRGDSLELEPYLLDLDSSEKPSEFQFIFIATDNVRYEYGFAATNDRIYQEWCVAYPNGKPQNWFFRDFDPDTGDYVWDIKASLKGERELWKKATRENALFLSTAVQLNSGQLKPVYDWFDDILRIIPVTGKISDRFTATLCKRYGSNNIVKFLKGADIDIDDIQISEKKVDSKSINLPSGMPDELKKHLISEFSREVKAVRTTKDGKIVEWDIDQESDGTQKLFSFSGPWLDTLKNGYILVIDELHSSLHPQIVRYLVDFFNNTATNKKNAQLIFTTHETSILNQNAFRRDQIWFCEKAFDRESELFSLTEFKPRLGRENLESVYLSGGYGAVPNVNDLVLMEKSIWED